MAKLTPKKKKRLEVILKRFMEDEDLDELNFQCDATTTTEDDRHVAWTVFTIRITQ